MAQRKLQLGMNDINRARVAIACAPARWAIGEVAKAKRTHTPGRYQQARLSAGRTAVAEVLFLHYPELRNRISNLTKALRLGMGEGVNFDELNELGAQALGLPKALQKSYQAYATGCTVTRDTPRAAATDFFVSFPNKRKCSVIEGTRDGAFFTVSYGRHSTGGWPLSWKDVTKKTAHDLPNNNA